MIRQVIGIINGDDLPGKGSMANYGGVRAGYFEMSVQDGAIALLAIEAVVLDLIEDQAATLGQENGTCICMGKATGLGENAIQDHINITKLAKLLNGIENG